MAERIGLVTDSNSQLPPELAERYGVAVVPLTVIVDGEPHAEGTELTADDFYRRFADGTPPEVSTAAPSPGAFAAAYEAAAGRGVDRILSIHVGSEISGTFNAARLATTTSPVPVHLLDTGTASFGVACCVWEAAEALAHGADLETAAGIAERLVPDIDNVFVVGALDLVRAGGRLAADTPATDAEIPVLSLVGNQIEVVGSATDVDTAARAMAAHVLRAAGAVRVAIGVADAAARPFWEALEERLRDEPVVREVVRYRIGPSVGVHTGPGTAGCFSWPAQT